MMKFEELNLPEQVLKGVSELGFHTPTEVQEKCIPIVMSGKDVIVQSKTGSGKTAGFGLPLLSKCDGKFLESVILVPTRELAVQVCKEIELLGKHSRVKTIPIYGGASINNQIRDLPGKGVVVATPGRFIDIFKQGYLKLDRVKYVVLDEADRMLDMGFEPDIRYIMSNLPKEKQTLLFSATMPEPIQRIAYRYMRSPELLLISKDEVNVESIVQTYYGTNDQKKLETLGYILDVEKPELAIVFCNTKRGADFVERALKMSGYNAVAIHGDLTQSRRERVIQDFKNKDIHILVASDVAARGLHVDDISHVINYDLPDDPDVYVHRIGRTGRVGKAGKAISIVTMGESRTFDMIRRRIRRDPARETIDPEKFRHHIIIPQRSQRGRGFGGGPRRGFHRGPRPGGHGGGFRGSGQGSGDRGGHGRGGSRGGGRSFSRGPRRRF